MPFRTLTLAQAAARLHLEVLDLSRLVKSGDVPFVRRGDEVAFVVRDLDAWVSQRLLGMTPARIADAHRRFWGGPHGLDADVRMIPRICRASWIEPQLASKTKPAVLRDMVALAATTEFLYDDAALLHGLEERERLCSTAIGDGVAFLHARYHDANLCSDSFVVLGRAMRPIFAGAADGASTDLFFLLCCQDDAVHLHVLSRLCAMAHGTSVLTELRQVGTGEEMLAALIRSEEALLRTL